MKKYLVKVGSGYQTERRAAGMDLRQILGMLAGVSGPNASGKYMAKCPAHEDRTASLTLSQKASRKDGKMRVYLCCHAGCAQNVVMVPDTVSFDVTNIEKGE